MVEVAGPIHAMSVGARVVIETGANRFIPCEVIGFAGANAVLMPFGSLDGVRRGCRAVIANAAGQVRPSAAWLGRVPQQPSTGGKTSWGRLTKPGHV